MSDETLAQRWQANALVPLAGLPEDGNCWLKSWRHQLVRQEEGCFFYCIHSSQAATVTQPVRSTGRAQMCPQWEPHINREIVSGDLPSHSPSPGPDSLSFVNPEHPSDRVPGGKHLWIWGFFSAIRTFLHKGQLTSWAPSALLFLPPALFLSSGKKKESQFSMHHRLGTSVAAVSVAAKL